MKIESLSDTYIQEKIDDKKLCEKASELLAHLLDFPYPYIHLKKDIELSEKITELKEELDISILEERIEKKILIEKLSSLIDKQSIDDKKENKFLDPAKSVLTLFDLVSKKQEAKKQEHFEKLQQINEELSKINQLIGIVHVQFKEGRVDLSKNSEAIQIIDAITTKYGMVEQKTPYIFENRNDLMAYLNQKAKEISNKTSEQMMFLQQGVDQLKSCTDITREMIKQDHDTKKHMLSKS